MGDPYAVHSFNESFAPPLLDFNISQAGFFGMSALALGCECSLPGSNENVTLKADLALTMQMTPLG